jgi:hypothetical protein
MTAPLSFFSRAAIAYLLFPVAGLAIGWAIWRLVARGGDLTASLGRLVVTGLVALGWLAVVLAAADALHPWLLAIIVGALLLAVWVLPGARRARLCWERPRLRWKGWPAALLLIVAAWLLARPAETFLVTDDAAVYTLAAAHLADTGSLHYDDPGVLPLDPRRPDLPLPSHTTAYWDYLQDYARQFLLPENVGLPAGTRFWGPFFTPMLYLQEVEIGFMPLTKTAGAIMGWALGVRRVVWAGPALALLALIALLGLTRRGGGWSLAVPATALLAFSLPQVWFGRQLLSEPLSQALVLGALWLDGEAQAASSSRARRALQTAQAAAFGLLPLVRLEGAFAALVLLAWLAWDSRKESEQADRYLWLCSAAALVLGQTLAILTSPAYFYSRVIGLLRSDVRVLLVWGLVLAAALVAAGCRWRGAAPVQRCWRWLRRWRTQQIGMSAIGAAYLLIAAYEIARGPIVKPYTIWLAQYWTRPGLLLGALGMALAPWVLPAEQRALRALLATGGCVGLLCVVNPMVTWAHPWLMRRALVALLPALAVGAAVAVGGLTATLSRLSSDCGVVRLAAWGSYALVMSGLCLGIAQRMLPILQHNEREGMWEQIAQVNALLAPDTLLLLDDGQIGRQLGQPLALINGHAVHNVQQTEALSGDSALIRQLIAAARQQGRRVYWLVSDSARRLPPELGHLQSVGGVRFDTPTLSASDGPPGAEQLIRQSFLVDVYELLAQPTSDLSGALDVPIGVGSYPYLLSGFYGLEEDPAWGSFRWTTGDADLRLPWPEAAPDAPAGFDIIVSLAAWRPVDGAAPAVIITVEGVPLIATTMPGDGALVEVQGSATDMLNTGDPGLEIQISSDTFVPRDHGLGSDARELGVKVYAVRVIPHTGAD